MGKNKYQIIENKYKDFKKPICFLLTLRECGFLSNPQEAQLLIQEDYQQKVAQAVCEGVMEYLRG